MPPRDEERIGAVICRATKDKIASELASFIRRYGIKEDFPMLDFTKAKKTKKKRKNQDAA